MQDLASFYTNEIKKYGAELSRIKKLLFVSSIIRLTVFCVAGLGIYLVFGDTKWVLAIILLAIALFLFLVSRHSDLQYKRDRLKALIQINETEIKVLQRDFHDLPEGDVFKDPLHYFSQDIDLFGRGSFYQYANRTALQQGRDTFAGLLKENSIANIPEKQEAIKELAQIPEWRQDFSAIASLVKAEKPYRAIIKWMKNYSPFVPSSMRYVPLIFSLLSVGLIATYSLEGISGWTLTIWFFLGLGITGRFFKKINVLSSDASKISDTFQQCQKLIVALENINFESDLLKKKKNSIISEAEKTSKIVKQFLKLLYALDQGRNLFMGPLVNGFFLWDVQLTHKIEEWVKHHGNSVEEWFETIAFFDAYNSLGNFAFNHPKYAYPILSKGDVILKSQGTGHPLLHPQKSILNDFQIEKEQFFIITGANMAGKSTFLRTVSLQIVMANVGLPVNASAVEYSPIKLITSMRTTDSLTDDESYFFSELKRLKFIVDEIQIDRYFIVLDEILKGTNSTDKAKGSRKFVERLVRSKSTGIIATHDLSLCEVAKELPQIQNHYFDAEIIDNELYFDYKFKEGICQNMNASFLLRKMEIVD